MGPTRIVPLSLLKDSLRISEALISRHACDSSDLCGTQECKCLKIMGKLRDGELVYEGPLASEREPRIYKVYRDAHHLVHSC